MKLIYKRVLIAIFLIIILTFTITTYLKGYVITSFSPIVNYIAEKSILVNVKDYKTLETKNFIIKYSEGNDEIAKMTGDIAQKHYKNICRMFNYFPKEKVRIIVYDNEKELLKNTNISKNSPPLGVYYGGIVHVLSPKLWIEDKDNLEEIYEKNGPIVHEIAHLIVDKITKGNYPIWLTEGIALYAEYKITGFEWGNDLEYEYDLSVEDLTNNFYSIDQSVAYRESFEKIINISNTWGFDKVVSVLNLLGEGSNFKDSTKRVLKINFEELNQKI